MSLSENAQAAINRIQDALSVSLSEEENRIVAKSIEQAMIDAIHEVTRASSDAVGKCCSPDRDIAAKLNDQIERNKKALIANLSSFR